MDIVSSSVYAPLASLTISNGSEGSISPSSPKSWEESLGQLSKGLQIICGSSPTHEVQPKSPGEFYGASAKLLSPTSPHPGLTKRSASRSIPTPRGHQPTNGHHVFFGRSTSSSASIGNPTRSTRPLIIRHEESNEKLKERLAQICKAPAKDGKSPPPSPPNHLSPKSACMVVRKESLKELFRAKIDISKYALKDIVVGVKNYEYLQIGEQTLGGLRVIAQYPVPKLLRYQKLACVVSENQTLCIREKTSDTMEAFYFGTDNIYLPIIYEDESNLKLVIALHVENGLEFEDVNVKTIDDDLVITGQKQPFSGKFYEDGRRALSCNSSFDAGCSTRFASSFRMVLKLPEGVDSRSVSGSISESNQLVIQATLDSSSRRYTC